MSPLGASPGNADLLTTGRQGEEPRHWVDQDPVPGLFQLDRRHHQAPHSPALRARGRGHVAATEERVASSQPPEDRTAAGLRESPRGLARRMAMAPRTGALMTGRGTR